MDVNNVYLKYTDGRRKRLESEQQKREDKAEAGVFYAVLAPRYIAEGSYLKDISKERLLKDTIALAKKYPEVRKLIKSTIQRESNFPPLTDED